MIGRTAASWVSALLLFTIVWVCGSECAAARMKVSSAAFTDGGMIPGRHAYQHENLSPELAWSGAPAGTKSFALICEDPDAPRGTWTHWVIFNIPPAETGLPEGVAKEGELSDGAVQGLNDFRGIGYDGPAPPYGVHRYIFKVYALDTVLDLRPGVTRRDLLAAMAGHILGQGQMTGRYKKRSGDLPE